MVEIWDKFTKLCKTWHLFIIEKLIDNFFFLYINSWCHFFVFVFIHNIIIFSDSCIFYKSVTRKYVYIMMTIVYCIKRAVSLSNVATLTIVRNILILKHFLKDTKKSTKNCCKV